MYAENEDGVNSARRQVARWRRCPEQYLATDYAMAEAWMVEARRRHKAWLNTIRGANR